MFEILEAIEGLAFLLEILAFLVDVARALGRGVAWIARWVASPFRTRRTSLSGGARKRVVYGGRKRP